MILVVKLDLSNSGTPVLSEAGIESIVIFGYHKSKFENSTREAIHDTTLQLELEVCVIFF